MTAASLPSATVEDVDGLLGFGFNRTRNILPFVIAAASVALLTAILAPLRHHFTLLNLGMLYLLLVVLLTARFGLWPGIVASALVNLALNFFFVPPVRKLDVNESENVIALAVFLLTTALTSWLLARAERSELLAREREKESALLFDLSKGVVADPGARTVLPLLAHKVRQSLGASSAAVFVGGPGRFDLVAADGVPLDFELTGDERLLFADAVASGEIRYLGSHKQARTPRLVGTPSVPLRVAVAPMIAAGQSLGILRVTGSPQQDIDGPNQARLLQTFASAAALAVNHQRLLRELTAAEALREADVLKSAVLSTVSHELRTPLASIKASVTSLIEATGQWDEADRREFLSAINEETDRLTSLISNLLDLSRLEGGALRLDRDWYDVGELLETVCGRLQPMLDHHPLRLDLANCDGDAYVDYVLLGQVVQNLAENAAKFSPSGSPIHIVARASGPDLELRVEDEGPGIPTADRERVFEKFYRGHQEGRANGVGLGLTISKGIVEAHGGKIRAESGEFGGAAFVVTIPASAFRRRVPTVVDGAVG